MKKQKNIPVLRFPEFTGEWEREKLTEIVRSIDSGWSPQCEEYSSNKNEWGVLKTTAVVWEGFNELENKKLPDKLSPRKELEVKFQDILITRAGPKNRVGVTIHVDHVREKLMISDKIIRVRTKENHSSKFLSIALTIDKSHQQLFSRSSGLATSQTNISQEIILSVVVDTPFLPEQTKIATFLTAVDDRLNQLKQKKSLLEQYKKGVMQKIFDQDIRFKDDDGNEFPDWEVTKFGLLYSFKATNSFSRDNLNYESGEVKNIHYGDIHTKFKPLLDAANENIPYINNEMDISKIPNDNFCKVGDLVIADASEDYNDIGKAIEVYNLNNEKVVAGLHTILAKPDLSKIALGFGAYLMKAEYIHFQIRVISQGTKVLGLSSNRLSDISVKLPCVNEQTKIASFLSAIDEKISLCNIQIAKTEQYKKGLLQQMFV